MKKFNEWGTLVEGEMNECGCRFIESDPRVAHPIPWEKSTKLEGPTRRHLEALWGEIKSLKERIEKLEDKKDGKN